MTVLLTPLFSFCSGEYNIGEDLPSRLGISFDATVNTGRIYRIQLYRWIFVVTVSVARNKR